MKLAYYNELAPFAAALLHELIKDGHIAPGDVDERSIKDVQAADLVGYRQCHFFAGIGGWSYALRLAGWPDDRPVWTGSCPCQPFSAAGKRGGFKDDRHLWPTWFRLIKECRPGTVFGEQVASKDGLGWLDAVSTDMEGADYAIGAFDLCAAGVGAPHIRQRLYFVADAQGWRGDGSIQPGEREGLSEPVRTSATRLVADAECWTAKRHGHDMGAAARDVEGSAQERQRVRDDGGDGSTVGELGDTDGRGQRVRRGASGSGGLAALTEPACVMDYAEQSGLEGQWRTKSQDSRTEDSIRTATRSVAEAGGTFWSDCIWLPCRDGKARPTKPGLFPLAHGVSNRVGILRGAGNAIVPPLAAEFIKAYMMESA